MGGLVSIVYSVIVSVIQFKLHEGSFQSSVLSSVSMTQKANNSGAVMKELS